MTTVAGALSGLPPRLASLAAAATENDAADQPVRGGTLIAAVHPEPSALIVAVNNQYANAVVSSNIFDGLLSYGEDQKPRAALATAWDVSPDGLAITFRLRSGVKWHDGTPFSSADVAYNVLEVWKKVHARGRITFAPVTSVETPDALTAILRLSRPAPVIMNALSPSESQLIPRHLYEGTDVRTNPYNLRPIGTGPFRFKNWKKGEYIELERNPDYWEGSKPYLDRVIFRSLPDGASRAAALEVGDLHYLPYSGVPYSDVARLRKNPQLRFESRGYEYSAQIYVIEFNLRRPHISDVRVRRAIAHAINRQSLIDTVWYGLSQREDGIIPRSLKQFYTEDKPTYPYDPAKAEALLDQAGVPRKAGGERFKISFTPSPSTEAYVQAAEMIRQDLKRVGIALNIERYDGPTYIRKIYTEYDFNMLIQGYSIMLDPELGLTRIVWSEGASRGVPYVNASGYASAQTDSIVKAYRSEQDPAKRQALFRELQRELGADLPLLPIMDSPFFTFSNQRVRGLETGPDAARSALADVWLQPTGAAR